MFLSVLILGCLVASMQVAVLATFGKIQWVPVKMAAAVSAAGYVAVVVVMCLHFDLSVSKSI